MNIADKMRQLQQEITQARHAYGAGDIILLPVSKQQEIAQITELYQLGIKLFGESYLGEAEAKITALPDDIIWHYIGAIQSNKLKKIAALFHWVHSVSNLKTAQLLSKHYNRPGAMQCLIQVNISGDVNKQGIAPDQLLPLAEQMQQLPNIKLRGLMAITKQQQSSAKLRADFMAMRQLMLALQRQLPEIDTLSMGMSADFNLAIECGATMVRIGSALFGTRATKI